MRGERAPKKRDFLVKIFQKVHENAFYGLFFQNFVCGADNFIKTETKPSLGRARKINSVDLKKKVDKIFENFLKTRPPPREILDPPLTLDVLNGIIRHQFGNISDAFEVSSVSTKPMRVLELRVLG